MPKAALPNWNAWQKIANGTLVVDDHFPISKHSRFGDDIWNLNDTEKPRHLTKAACWLRINWHKHSQTLPQDLLRSTKILALFFAHYPAALTSPKRTGMPKISPSYCCHLINTLLNFWTAVCLQARLPNCATDRAGSYIQSLADLTLFDFEKALAHERVKEFAIIRRCLEAFTSPILLPYLPADYLGIIRVPWTIFDLKTLDFNRVKPTSPLAEVDFGDKPLSDNQFSFLTKVATKDVLSFLLKLNRCPKTPTYAAEVGEHGLFSKYSDFAELYEAFIAISSSYYEATQNQEGIGKCSVQKRAFQVRFGISFKDMRMFIERIQTAARYLILQFVGLRYSEAALLRIGCIKVLPSGEYVLQGSVIKGQSINLLTGLDYWVACPIVQDAVVALEEIARFTKKQYLFAANKHAPGKQVDRPMGANSLNRSLTAYLYDIDEQRQYSVQLPCSERRGEGVSKPYALSTHRLRHTLTLHMCRANVGIPLISLHLKHVYQGYKRLTSLLDVTLKYGGIGNDIFYNAVGIKQANRELTQALYHPEAPIVGPGAPDFIERRTSYFTGMLARGRQVDEVMEELAERGVQLADVGLGYCQGRQEIELEDGNKRLPPCLGQLKCNPARCKNALIPALKVPIWQQLYKENKQRMDDPLLAHARPEFEHMVQEAYQVPLHLGVPIE